MVDSVECKNATDRCVPTGVILRVTDILACLSNLRLLSLGITKCLFLSSSYDITCIAHLRRKRSPLIGEGGSPSHWMME
eukprot:scaffold698_cov133-Alexandrium_tamarense.AAC.7